MIIKIVSETERSTTVQATTELTKVKFNDAWSYYAIRNDGSAEAYVSKRAFSNTTEDGVISIPAQGVASIPASVKSIYITGSGSVLVLGQNTPSLPFDRGGKGGGSYELPIATTEILGGVMPDGTTINVDENGVISTVGGHTVDTLLDITFNVSTDSMPLGGKTIILPRNITDYKFLYCTHAYVKSASYDKNTSVDDGLLNKSLIPTETLGWDYWKTETTLGYGTLLYDIEVSVEQPENPVKVYIKSENELYFKPMSTSIYIDHRFLMMGIK